MNAATGIVALRRVGRGGITAVPYVGGRRRPPVRLPDGAIVEVPLPEQRRRAPERPEEFLAVGRGGRAATIHDVILGLTTAYAALTGVFVLPSGEVAAVYGAEADALG